MEKIPSKILLSGGQADVNVPENRDGAREVGAMGMSVRCCAGIIWYHGLPEESVGETGITGKCLGKLPETPAWKAALQLSMGQGGGDASTLLGIAGS